jgi:hypothetical protein
MPVLRRSVLAFCHHPVVDRLLLVIGDGQQALCAQALEGLDLPPPVIGGQSRQDFRGEPSVRTGRPAGSPTIRRTGARRSASARDG